MCIATITAIATTVATSIATAASAAAAIVVGGAAAGSATAAVGGAAVGGAAAGSAAAAAAAAVGGATVGGAAVGGAAATGLGATAFTIGSTSVSWGALGLGALAVGGAVAGGVTSIVSGVQNAKMQEAQAEYMAEMEAENAKTVARQAEALDLQGNQERAQLHGKMLQTKGEARASYAAGGVVLGAGSSADYEADIADTYDLDSRNLNYDIASRKWKLQVQANNAANQSALYKAQAGGYRSQQATSILSGTFNTVGNTANALGGAVSVSDRLGWLY